MTLSLIEQDHRRTPTFALLSVGALGDYVAELGAQNIPTALVLDVLNRFQFVEITYPIDEMLYESVTEKELTIIELIDAIACLLAENGLLAMNEQPFCAERLLNNDEIERKWLGLSYLLAKDLNAIFDLEAVPADQVDACLEALRMQIFQSENTIVQLRANPAWRAKMRRFGLDPAAV